MNELCLIEQGCNHFCRCAEQVCDAVWPLFQTLGDGFELLCCNELTYASGRFVRDYVCKPLNTCLKTLFSSCVSSEKKRVPRKEPRESCCSPCFQWIGETLTPVGKAIDDFTSALFSGCCIVEDDD